MLDKDGTRRTSPLNKAQVFLSIDEERKKAAALPSGQGRGRIYQETRYESVNSNFRKGLQEQLRPSIPRARDDTPISLAGSPESTLEGIEGPVDETPDSCKLSVQG